MNNRDIIRTFERTMLVRFGTTGELQGLTTLRLDGVTFKREGNTIHAGYNDGHPSFVLERFPSEPLATSAFERLQTVLTRYAQMHRFATIGKGLIKWVGAPFVVVVLALAVNMVATRALDPSAAMSASATPPLLPLPNSMELIQQGMGVPSPPQPRLSAQEVSKAMADGVRSKKYSVQLSQGSKGTLYVFSDPACPHCKELEPELVKLAQDYTIHIFPVSLIGEESSSHRVAKLLCAKPATRAALWKQVIGGEDLGSAECTEGTTATAANNQIFKQMGFPGTPTIINGAGEQTPDDVPNTADGIRQWMKARRG